VRTGNVRGFAAMGAILKPQQLPDFIQTEPQALRGLYEFHAGHVRFAVAPDTTIRAIRFDEQPLALIEADRLDIDLGRFGEGSDSQISNSSCLTPYLSPEVALPRQADS
jgi:hypothetical protein